MKNRATSTSEYRHSKYLNRLFEKQQQSALNQQWNPEKSMGVGFFDLGWKGAHWKSIGESGSSLLTGAVGGQRASSRVALASAALIFDEAVDLVLTEPASRRNHLRAAIRSHVAAFLAYGEMVQITYGPYESSTSSFGWISVDGVSQPLLHSGQGSADDVLGSVVKPNRPDLAPMPMREIMGAATAVPDSCTGSNPFGEAQVIERDPSQYRAFSETLSRMFGPEPVICPLPTAKPFPRVPNTPP